MNLNVERMVGGVRVRLDTADAHTVTATLDNSRAPLA